MANPTGINQYTKGGGSRKPSILGATKKTYKAAAQKTLRKMDEMQGGYKTRMDPKFKRLKSNLSSYHKRSK